MLVPPRMEILNKLLTIHMHGFSHSDFAERNVVRGPHGHRIIDLELMSKHQCPWERNIVCKDRDEYFPCPDLKRAANTMRIWREGI